MVHLKVEYGQKFRFQKFLGHAWCRITKVEIWWKCETPCCSPFTLESHLSFESHFPKSTFERNFPAWKGEKLTMRSQSVLCCHRRSHAWYSHKMQRHCPCRFGHCICYVNTRAMSKRLLNPVYTTQTVVQPVVSCIRGYIESAKLTYLHQNPLFREVNTL